MSLIKISSRKKNFIFETVAFFFLKFYTFNAGKQKAIISAENSEEIPNLLISILIKIIKNNFKSTKKILIGLDRI